MQPGSMKIRSNLASTLVLVSRHSAMTTCCAWQIEKKDTGGVYVELVDGMYVDQIRPWDKTVKLFQPQIYNILLQQSSLMWVLQMETQFRQKVLQHGFVCDLNHVRHSMHFVQIDLMVHRVPSVAQNASLLKLVHGLSGCIAFGARRERGPKFKSHDVPKPGLSGLARTQDTCLEVLFYILYINRYIHVVSVYLINCILMIYHNNLSSNSISKHKTCLEKTL